MTLPDGNSLHPLADVIARMKGQCDTRGLTLEELDAIREMPTVRHGHLTAQRRVATAKAALRELQPDELLTVLQSLDQVKGRVWAAVILRKAADNVENGK